MTKVLVTGAAGNLGSYLCEELLAHGCDVRAMVHYGNQNIAHLKDQLEVVKADIRFSDEVYDAVKDCTQVFHLAALIHVDRSRRIPLLFYETNVRGTMNVLEAARREGADVVHMSTCEVIGNIPAGKADEDWSVKQPRSPYASSKYAAEAYCYAYKATYDMRVNIARGFNLCGPKQKKGEKGAVIPIFVDRVLHGLPPIIYGSGEQIRDYIDVRDLVKGLRLFMDSKMDGELIHFCSGVPTSVNDLARLICETVDNRLAPIHVEGRPGELLRSVGDNSKAKKLLGWMPETSLKQSIHNIVHTQQHR